MAFDKRGGAPPRTGTARGGACPQSAPDHRAKTDRFHHPRVGIHRWSSCSALWPTPVWLQCFISPIPHPAVLRGEQQDPLIAADPCHVVEGASDPNEPGDTPRTSTILGGGRTYAPPDLWHPARSFRGAFLHMQPQTDAAVLGRVTVARTDESLDAKASTAGWPFGWIDPWGAIASEQRTVRGAIRSHCAGDAVGRVQLELGAGWSTVWPN